MANCLSSSAVTIYICLWGSSRELHILLIAHAVFVLMRMLRNKLTVSEKICGLMVLHTFSKKRESNPSFSSLDLVLFILLYARFSGLRPQIFFETAQTNYSACAAKTAYER
ncbi:MAG: hypothetical protein IJV29_09015 [Butyrivibrio sp.]|nr:hypothetical protein [Butyrivibrio sp.]